MQKIRNAVSAIICVPVIFFGIIWLGCGTEEVKKCAELLPDIGRNVVDLWQFDNLNVIFGIVFLAAVLALLICLYLKDKIWAQLCLWSAALSGAVLFFSAVL